MSAQPASSLDDCYGEQLLDADTSAAILRWMETGSIPEGIDREIWERWLDGDCQGLLEVDGMPVTAAMLGRWAATGTLR